MLVFSLSSTPSGPTPAQLEALYTQHASFVHARCRRILKDEDLAWDATQDVFARAIRSWDSFDGRSSRGTWLYRIATNLCLNRIRDAASRRDKLHQRRDERPGAGSGPASPAQVEVHEIVRAVLVDMPEDLARLAVLYYFEDLTQAEIAAEVGLSVPTVRKRLRAFVAQARKRIARGLEAQLAAAGDSL